MMAVSGQRKVKKAISNYFTKLRYIKISLNGKDLIKMGLLPGPIFREVLDAVLDGRLNGQIRTVEEEREFVENYVRSD